MIDHAKQRSPRRPKGKPTPRTKGKKTAKRKPAKRSWLDTQLDKFNDTETLLGGLQTIVGIILACLFIYVLYCLVDYVRHAKVVYSAVHSANPSEEEQVLAGSWGNSLGYQFFNYYFGWGSFILNAVLAVLCFKSLRSAYLSWTSTLGYIVRILALTACVALVGASLQSWFASSDSVLSWGGAIGESWRAFLSSRLGVVGLVLVLIVALLVTAALCSRHVLRYLSDPTLPTLPTAPEGFKWKNPFRRESREGDEDEFVDEYDADDEDYADDADDESDALDDEYDPIDDEASEQPPITTTPSPFGGQATQGDSGVSTSTQGQGLTIEVPTGGGEVEEVIDHTPYTPGLMLKDYRKPSIDLLKDYGASNISVDKAEIEYTKQRILDTLASFKIQVMPHKATVGPTVTLYEVIPEQGVKVARIAGLVDDLALNLKSEGIRIIAPMPGQGTVGIEVPNSRPQTVSMRSIMASRRYNDELEKMELPVGIGKTITNDPFIFDLAKMPHLLIAGATGQGKSVGLNAMITSLLYSKRPEELKFVMVDPKMLEFSVYEELENHFMAMLPDSEKAIITDMTKVVPTLNSLCIEMDNRYELLTRAKVRNIKEYNQQVREGVLSRSEGFEFLPYIVLIVDEFADLIMTRGKEVEAPIARLAQKARAAGIHMVIATQRPSTDVITGLIKANFPARIAFKVFAMVDSRTILDSPGANQLIGRGDMLFYQGKEMVRVQCAFMDTPETQAIVEHISTQASEGHPYVLPEYVPESDGSSGAGDFNPKSKDALFEEAARLVVNAQVGSASVIQRKLGVGFARAGRIVDQLEAAGILGPQRGSKPRDILVTDHIELESILTSLR